MVLAARLVVPAGATGTSVPGIISAVERVDGPASRVMSISPSACDFRGFSPGSTPPSDPTGANHPIAWSFGISPSVQFLLSTMIGPASEARAGANLLRQHPHRRVQHRRGELRDSGVQRAGDRGCAALRAAWLPALTVQHFPDASRQSAKAASYRERLRCAIAREPRSFRYHWFLGYMDFLDGRFDSAIGWLNVSGRGTIARVPGGEFAQRDGTRGHSCATAERHRLRRTLDVANDFFASVRNDF